jgi:putative transposase
VSKRVSPSEKIRARIDALFAGSRELVEIIEDVARLGAQLIIQTAVEAEVTEFLGRARYQRLADCPDARSGRSYDLKLWMRDLIERAAYLPD